MPTLELEIRLKPSPWDNYPNTPYETWCAFTFIHRNEGESAFTVVLAHEWDFMPYFEWFTENSEVLRHENLEIAGISDTQPRNNESLTQTLTRLHDIDLDDFENEAAEDHYIDALYNYRTHHNLKMASRGAAIPDIFIGMNHGHGEISVDQKKLPWAYTFDMEAFFEGLRASFKNALSQWRDSTTDAKVHAFILTLEAQLETIR